jgi:response regulator of citrate/malate metabolism
MLTPYVMLVESNPILAKILLSILCDEMGFRAMFASTREEALTRMKVRQPMLLLLDEFLLDGDSIIFYDHVHQHVVTTSLPTIILSRNVYRCQQLIGKRQISCLPLPTNSNDLAQAIRPLLKLGIQPTA